MWSISCSYRRLPARQPLQWRMPDYMQHWRRNNEADCRPAKRGRDAIMMFDADGCLSMLNPAAEKLFTDYETKLGLPLARGHGYDIIDRISGRNLHFRKTNDRRIRVPDRRVFYCAIHTH